MLENHEAMLATLVAAGFAPGFDLVLDAVERAYAAPASTTDRTRVDRSPDRQVAQQSAHPPGWWRPRAGVRPNEE